MSVISASSFSIVGKGGSCALKRLNESGAPSCGDRPFHSRGGELEEYLMYGMQ